MGYAATLALLALAGGFAFVERCNLTRYRVSRAESQRLLFYAACAGFLLVVLSKILLVLISSSFPTLYKEFRGNWAWGLPTHDPWLATFVGAFLLGWVLVCPLNHMYDLKTATDDAIERYGKLLEKTLVASLNRTLPIFLTCRSRKVYVGYVQAVPPVLEGEVKHISILPVISGYRDTETLNWIATTQYADIYEKIEKGEIDLSAEDFEIVIPTSEIVSVNLFALDLDQHLFEIPQPSAALSPFARSLAESPGGSRPR